MRRCLTLYGFTCLIGQVLALRELAVIFHGNELVYGVALAAWLLLVALGAVAAGRIARRLTLGLGAFTSLLAAGGLLVPISLLLARGAYRFTVGPTGVVPGFGGILLITLVVLAPLCLVLGAFFAVACAIAMRAAQAGREPSHITATRLFVFEALGAIIAGVAFTFVLIPRLDAFLTALGLAAADLLAAFAVWWHGDRRRRPWGWAFPFLAAAIITLLASPIGRVLDFASQATRFPDSVLRDSRDTHYGRVDVVQRQNQIAFYQNGVLSGATDMDASAEETVFPGILAHPRPRRLLLIGGAVSGALDKALLFPLLQIDCVELDPALIKMGLRFLRDRHRRALRDPRVHLITDTDARRFLKSRPASYDVIISALPNPTSGLLNRFYTLDFFLEARRALRDDGILAFRIDGAPDYMSDAHRSLVAAVYRTLARAFGRVAVLPSAHSVHLIATTRRNAAPITRRLFSARLEARAIRPRWLTPRELDELTEPLRVARLHNVLRSETVHFLNTDLHPLAYLHSLRLWADRFEMRGRGLLRRALRLNLPWTLFGIIAAALLVALILIILPDPTPTALGAVRASAGAAGFLLQMVLLFAFQSFYGYAYGAIALLFAAFMVGTALGAVIAASPAAPRPGAPLIALLQVALALLAAVTLLLLRKLGASSLPAAPIIIPLINLTAGALVGAQYPVSVAVCAPDARDDPARRAARAAWLYAADLAGACLGASLGATLLIPILGLENTASVVAALCLAGLPLLLLAERKSRPLTPT